MAIKKNWLFEILLNSICLSGLLYQINKITDIYFQYKTRTATQVLITYSVSNPTLHSCVKARSLFDFKRWNRDSHISKKFKLTSEYQSSSSNISIERKFNSMLTLKEIFEYTPSTDEIIEYCRLRKPDEYAMKDYNTSECYEFFIVSKYFHREFMCYHFKLTKKILNGKKYEIDQVLFSQYAQSVMYRVALNKTLTKQANYLTAFAQIENSNLLYSTGMSDSHFRTINSKSRYNLVSVTYYIADTESQLPPYETNCRDYGSGNTYADIRYECLNQQMSKRASRILLSYPIHNGSIPKKIFIPSNDDPLIQRASIQSAAECLKKIGPYRTTCDFRVAISKMTVKEVSWMDNLSFELTWPKNVGFRIIHEPNTTFIDFFVYIFSSFGTWYGFSFFAFGSFIHDKVTKKVSKKDSKDWNRLIQRKWITERKHLMNYISMLILSNESLMARGHRRLWRELDSLRVENINIKRRLGKCEKCH